VHVRVGTFSKALGAAGGFVAGSSHLIHWLRHTARAWIFSTAHPRAVAAAATKAIELLAAEPHRRQQLLAMAAAFRADLTRQGIPLDEAAAHIVPVVAGRAEAAVALAERLAAAGMFVPAIRPPSVPEGRSLVRASVAWHHTPHDLERLAAVLLQARP